ncbi:MULTISPECIES: site-2 protease family protein [unclassified Streptomyces]|uniref:site-2 protease family protein n=1 Tax=unclassified Streptomyces TaxID=2593676 RepID=UPI001F0455F2|nr:MULTISPECIES: site-2 protease family protein [unclassified Streptomyces]MCH0562317.1 site-2 protease family protein [Streptomyces sp. MUM 2J]MCH0572922.1 site-2 protease family protein [Streptomyces sp. MUM 136J]
MKETLPLGRIAGIRVGLHWSVLVIIGLVAGTLAVGRFPDVYPGHPAWVYWILALLAAVVFLGSLLAHELAHAVVARRNGVAVDDITLWMLGGIARLRSEARTPGAELRIAAVGPLTSAVIGGLCAALALWLDALHASGLVVEAVAWLAAINIVLAVFNALPAAPLDGGRLLRAWLWRRTGDRLRATRGAATAGRTLGWFMIVTGFAAVLLAGDLSGLWAALIGWFLTATATAEERQAQLRGVLADLPVSRVMTRDPVTVPATATLAAFLAEGPFGHYRHSAFPVVAPDGTVAGLITVPLVNRTPVEARSTTTVGAVMRPLADVTTSAPDDPVVDLLPRLESSRERRALVLDGGRLVGIVTLADISRALSWLTAATRPRA